jgi:small-conductance mechanosensitive channel
MRIVVFPRSGPRGPRLRLILRHFTPVCNASLIWELILHFFAIFVASITEPALTVLERDWRADLLVMLRERLPKVLIILVILFILQRIIKFLVERMEARALKTCSSTVPRSTQLRTMATIIRATSYSVLGILAFLQLLKLANIDYAPLLASAGIVGVGVGLAAQSLFKDVLNSMFILIEDQYNVGEVVKIASLTGTVEDLTLRLTRLRGFDGTLNIIPNSQVATVTNMSRDYTQSSLPVSVDASANPDHVLRILAEIIASVQDQPAFSNVLIEKPSTPGIDKIDGRTLVYPINFRVRPRQEFDLSRELRKQIVVRFEAERIPLGSDTSMLVMQQQAKDATAPPVSRTIGGG